MADISILSRVLNGAVRSVDLTTNTPVVLSIKIGGITNTELTKTILDNLILLQNGGDAGSLHNHDGRYYTKTEINASSGTSGASLVGVAHSASNYSPSSATVEGHLAAIDAALAITGSTEFSDASFRIQDDIDNTKKIAFEASGISSGSVRTITMPDANVNLADVNNAVLVDGSRTFTGNQSMGGYRLTNLADPSAASDAATKQYVDSVAQGLKPKQAVRVATTANLSSLSGLLTIDGVTLVAGDRVLVKDQTTAADNGIYVAASGAWSRASDFDQLTPIDEINGAYVAVQEGTANAGKLFVQTGNVSSIGSDPINFVFFNAIGNLTGGDGISIVGNDVSVDHDGQGLQFTSGQLSLELDGSTLSKSASGLKVADGGINTLQLADSAVSTAKIADGAVSTVKIADGAVDQNKLSNTVGDGLTITGGGGTQLSAIRSINLTLPSVLRTAGENFAAGVWAVRFGIDSLSETAGRLYKADNDASSSDKFYAVAIAIPSATVNSGSNFNGSHIITYGRVSTVTAMFTAADAGKPVFLGASGALTLTPPSAPGTAVVRLGVVIDANNFFFQGAHVVGIN